ncbi:MAG: hypothetical protein U5R31_17180 [Acidimicrobiia bacterium]|nr:hypothetical protein [Acidimicrobiia bacterium]
MIVIYPWHADLLMPLGERKPEARVLRHYERWSSGLLTRHGEWFLAWSEDTARRYCLDYLVLHEVGHHLDWYRNRWSKAKANRRRSEDRADSYAVLWSAEGMQRCTPG